MSASINAKTSINSTVISRIRRNHALEHATLHILSARFPRIPLGGISNWNGFWIIGNVPTVEVGSAFEEGIQRLKGGEHKLAVHPNCGTNLATAGIFAGLVAFLLMLGVGRRLRDKLERLPLVAASVTMAILMAQPLGLLIQRKFTTCSDIGELTLVSVTTQRLGGIFIHRVVTRE